MTDAPGTVLFEFVTPGCSAAQLALFSAATEDPNPIHVDADFARRAGFPAVLQQGPMTTAYFAHHLRARYGARLAALDVTFTAPVFVGERLRLTATVAADGTLILAAAKLDGTPTARGTATLRP
jgi:acyl dehydratase